MHVHLANAVHQAHREHQVGIDTIATGQPARCAGGVQVVAPELLQIDAFGIAKSRCHAVAQYQVAHHDKTQHAQSIVHRANGARKMKVGRIGQAQQLGTQGGVGGQLSRDVIDGHLFVTEAGNQLLGDFRNGGKFVGLFEQALEFHVSVFPCCNWSMRRVCH